MHLAPLLYAPWPVRLHVATVLPAALIGAWLLLASERGSAWHRAAGRVYVVLLVVGSLDALLIHTLNPAGWLGFSPIHLLVPVTLYGLIGGVVAARRGDRATHRRMMIRTYVLGILVAGAFTLMPQRLMHAVVFGT